MLKIAGGYSKHPFTGALICPGEWYDAPEENKKVQNVQQASGRKTINSRKQENKGKQEEVAEDILSGMKQEQQTEKMEKAIHEEK